VSGEVVLPIYGPAFGRDGEVWSLLFPIKKKTAGMFSVEAVETAVKISLQDNLPDGFDIDYERPFTMQWNEDPARDMVIIATTAFVKEASHATE
jgi:hypothetical protein